MKLYHLPASVLILSLLGTIAYAMGLMSTSVGRTGFARGKISLNVFYMPSYTRLGKLMVEMSFQAAVYTFTLPLAAASAALLSADRKLRPSFAASLAATAVVLAVSARCMRLPTPVVKETGRYTVLQLPSGAWLLPLLLAHISLSIIAYRLMPEGKIGSALSPVASLAVLLSILLVFAPLVETRVSGVEVRVPRASYTKLAEAIAKIALYPLCVAGRLPCSLGGLAARYAALLLVLPMWLAAAKALLAAYQARKLRQQTP